MVHLFAIAGVSHLPASIPEPSIDAIILAIAGVVVAYSIVAGYAALVRESISIYVGLVLANYFGEPLYRWISHGGARAPISQTVIQLVLLLVPIVLLQFGRRHHAGAHHHHNLVVKLISAFLTAMLLISAIMSQLDDLTLANVQDQSNLASWIYQLKLAWLALVPIAVVATGLLGGRLHRSHRKG